MGDHQQSGAGFLHQIFDEIQHLRPEGGAEGGKGFIKQDPGPRLHQNAGERGAALLATR